MATVDGGGDRLHFTDEGEGRFCSCMAATPGWRCRKVRVGLFGAGRRECFPRERMDGARL